MTGKPFRSALLLCTSAISLGTAAGVAQAQTAAAPAVVGLEEIVVTAQRREENLQRAAIAVSAVTGENLNDAGVTEVTNLSKMVPSLIVQQTLGSSINFYIRGVGTFAANALTENAIAFSFNGVYVGRASAPLGTFYDLERVEVLKGPQGTLYGRNATGGAINVIPRRPSLSGFGGEIMGEYGNYDSKRLQAAVNVPLGDIAALRVAGQILDRDGYLSDGYDDEGGSAARVSLLVEPNDKFSAVLVVDYARLDFKGAGPVMVPGPLTPTAPPISERIGGSDPLSLAELARFPLVAGGLVVGPRPDGYVNGEFWGLSATLTADLGFADLTLIPAYRHSRPDYRSYAYGFFGQNDELDKQTSVEARLSSKPGSRLNYVAGAFYFNEKQTADNLFNQGPVSITNFINDLTNRSYAVFGQATYELTPGLRIVGGVRYTHETRKQDTLLAQRTLANPNPPFIPVLGEEEFTSTTYKVGVEYDVAPQSLLFANISTGFKSGGFFVGIGDNSFQPEKLTAYTVGSKNRFLDNRLQLNVEAFYWKYKDQQVGYIGPIQTGPGVFGAGGRIANAGDSRIFGFEAEMRFQLTGADEFTADVQYLDSKYDRFSYQALSPTGAPPRNACSLTPETPSTLTPPARLFTVDCSGRSLVNAPKWSFNLSYEHRFDLPGGFSLTAGARTRIESSRYLALEYLPEERQDSYMASDLLLTLDSPDRTWSVSGFVNNVEDKTLLAGAGARPFLNNVYVTLRAPRTYGARVIARF